MREAINLIWKLSVLAKLAVAARLLQQGLAGTYPALMTACCILPIKSLLLMYAYSYVTHDGANQRRQAAEYLTPIEWVVSSWIVFELFSQWTRNYTGIGRFGKFLLAALLALALLASVAFWHAEWRALVFAQNFRIFYIVNRMVLGTLAIFVAGTWVFFRNYPVPIAPNVVRHTYIAVVYFLVMAFSLLAFTLNGLKFVGLVNLALVTMAAACFSAWAIVLNRKGQEMPAFQRVSREDTERIERINKELLAFMRGFPEK